MNHLSRLVLTLLVMVISTASYASTDIETTDLSTLDYAVYCPNTEVIGEKQFTLPICLKNQNLIATWQADLVLPEGFSVATDSYGDLMAVVSGDRTNSSRHSITIQKMESGNVRILYASQSNKEINGTDGEIATLTINIAEDVVDDNYAITFKSIVMAEANETGHELEKCVSKVTYLNQAQEITYDEGYAVEILPFAFTSDLEVPFTIDNAANLTNVAFDVVVPASFVSGELYYIDPALAKTKYTTASELNADGSIHVTVDRRSSNVIATGEGTSIAILGLVYDAAVGNEVYPIAIQNIELTGADGTVYHATPYSTEIYAGTSPTATLVDGVATFHGNYGGATEMALLKAAMPTHATVDLTEVSALAEDLTATAYDNVIVTADKVAYGREVSNSWGSICLPFAVESNDDIQFYALSGATSESLQFEKVASVEANTPAIFKAASSSFCMNTENDGTFAANFAATQPSIEKTQSVTNWVMNGTYADKTVDVSSLQAYAISGNEVHKITETLNALAFRAWFQNNGAALGARLRLEEDATGIEVLESEDGNRVEIRFDLQGRQVKSGNTSTMTIENGKVIINK